ncbi:MAG: acyltransferase [Bacillota bacterium]|nr:acyltransferase [Bacillota bacterium]
MENSSPNRRIYVIDYIKAAAMISVIINHCNFTSAMEKELLYPFFIGLAVPFFILVSGFTFSLSFRKREEQGISHWYKKDIILPKLSRFLLPYFFIFALELIYKLGPDKMVFDLPLIIRTFFFGGYGPGSYYIPIIIQMLFIFPLCYWLIRKKSFSGVIILGLIQLIYQIVVYNIGLEDIYYKRIFLRFLIFLAGGIYLYLHREDILKSRRNKILLLLSFVGGFIYIYLVNYQGHVPAIFSSWRRTAMPTFFYVFPVLAVIVSGCLYKQISGKTGAVLSLIGAASYHIFLVQMFWFHIGWEKTLAYPAEVTVNLIFTIAVGIMFYKADSYLRKRAKSRKERKSLKTTEAA